MRSWCIRRPASPAAISLQIDVTRGRRRACAAHHARRGQVVSQRRRLRRSSAAILHVGADARRWNGCRRRPSCSMRRARDMQSRDRTGRGARASSAGKSCASAAAPRGETFAAGRAAAGYSDAARRATAVAGTRAASTAGSALHASAAGLAGISVCGTLLVAGPCDRYAGLLAGCRAVPLAEDAAAQCWRSRCCADRCWWRAIWRHCAARRASALVLLRSVAAVASAQLIGALRRVDAAHLAV